MPEQALANGDVRPEKETFVISQSQDGYRVYSVHQPSRSFNVREENGCWICTCPEFVGRRSDPNWRCRHILAVAPRPKQEDVGTVPNTAPIPINGRAAAGADRMDHESGTHMLIKRSVSPDGRIDSVSVEFSLPVDGDSQSAITDKALRTLKLQREIVAHFLAMNGKAVERSAEPKTNGYQNGLSNGTAPNGQAVSAQITDISEVQGRWGPRLVLNFQVNGNRCSLFGSAKQLASQLANAGCSYDPQELRSGLRLNQPCRVITEPSKDGKYMNVVEVLAPVAQNNGYRNGRAQ